MIPFKLAFVVVNPLSNNLEITFNGVYDSGKVDLQLDGEPKPEWSTEEEPFSEWFIIQQKLAERTVLRFINHCLEYPKDYPIYPNIGILAKKEYIYDSIDQEWYWHSSVSYDDRPTEVSIEETVEGDMVDGGITTQVIHLRLPPCAVRNGRPKQDIRIPYKYEPCGCGYDMCGHAHTISCTLMHDMDSDEWIITHKFGLCC